MRRQRRLKDIGIGGMAAHWYDKNTKKYRMLEMKQYADEVASQLRDGSAILEVAPGPGYLAIELAKLGKFWITGLDVSKDFVEIARRNAKNAGVPVDFQQGSASEMPFEDSSFDFIVCTAAFKNFKEPSKALSEMYRVLRPGGKSQIVDMNRNSSERQIQEYTERLGATGVDKLLMNLVFKHFLRNGAYTREELVGLISESPFKKFSIEDEGIALLAKLAK
jgi:ubiquinone/menaquinone biosynthesis C-methylase UbiE